MIDRQYEPLSVDEIYRVAMFRVNLDKAIEKPTQTQSKRISLSKLSLAQTSPLNRRTYDIKNGSSFKSYRDSQDILHGIISKYTTELKETKSSKMIFLPLLPTIVKMLNESKTIASEVVYHLYSLHKCASSIRGLWNGNYPVDLFSSDFDDISDMSLFKNWSGQEITDFLNFFMSGTNTEQELDYSFFRAGSSTDSWNLDLSSFLRTHARDNKLNIDKIRFAEAALPSSGVYEFAKSQFHDQMKKFYNDTMSRLKRLNTGKPNIHKGP